MVRSPCPAFACLRPSCCLVKEYMLPSDPVLHAAYTAHTWPTAAARNEKYKFSGPLSKTPKIFAPKSTAGVPWSYPENFDPS